MSNQGSGGPPARAAADGYAPAFERYVARVPEADVLAALERQGDDVRAFLAALPADRAAHRYAPDKWTVHEVVAHVIDSERVFAYRALCVARGEAVDLPGFDENAYADALGDDPATLAALGEEFALVRRANLMLFRRFDTAAWARRGKARGFALTARGMAYVMVGHVRHHAAVLAEKYGLAGGAGVSETGGPGVGAPRVAVVGAGAVGGFFGGMLARAGVPVTFVGRAPHVAALASDGLRLESLAFDERLRVRATADAADARDAEVVLVCVKTNDTAAAARALAPVLAPGTLVVSLQNGLENVGVMRSAGVASVPAAVYVAAAMAGPGHVKHTGRGDLIVEAPGDAARRVLLDRLAAAFARAGVSCRVVPDASPDLWMKLVLNCAFNAISALGQARYARIADDPAAWGTLRRAVEEAVAVAAAEGVTLPGDALAAAQALADAMPQATSSTAQDLALGKRTEIAALNGYVARRGWELGVATPVNEALTALVQLLETHDRAAL